MEADKRFDSVIRTQLSVDESPLSIAELRVPKKFTKATSFFSIVILVRLFDESRNYFSIKKTQRQFTAVKFPIARRMLVCITEQRILIWKLSSWHPQLKFLGSSDSKGVRATELARTTHVNWHLITIELDGSRQIQIGR